MEEFRADLHCHSRCSDGSDSSMALLQKAKDIGLSALSITDHDTLAAYTPELFTKAKELNIQLLPGIELSTNFHQSAVHILGYGFDLNSKSFQAFVSDIQEKRFQRNQKIYDKFTEKKIFLPIDLLDKQKVIGRPHFAEKLIQLGYVKTFQEAFQRYLKEGASCYVSGFKASPSHAIDEIHKANGKAVLAHPHFCRKGVLRYLLSLPFDGIECYYGNLSDEKRFLEVVRQKNWIATGGSDYHGDFKPNIPLGCSWVCEKTYLLLSSK